MSSFSRHSNLDRWRSAQAHIYNICPHTNQGVTHQRIDHTSADTRIPTHNNFNFGRVAFPLHKRTEGSRKFHYINWR